MKVQEMTVPPMRVETHISGSYCVVYPTNNPELYIDCRKDPRGLGSTYIELVLNGHVRHRVTVFNDKAPETIIQITRDIRK